MKRIITILSLLFTVFLSDGYAQNTRGSATVNGQTTERQKISRRGRVNRWTTVADKAFDSDRYFKAVGYYERAFRRAPEGNVRMQLRERLGETQLKLNHPVEAAVYLERVWEHGNREKRFLTLYADALLKTAAYNKAEFIYTMLYNLDTTDMYFKNRLLSCKLGQSYFNVPIVIADDEVLPQPRISTAFAEHGTSIVDGLMIYNSAQRVSPLATDYRTGEGFSHLYAASLALDSMLWSEPKPLSFNIWDNDVSDGSFSYDKVNKIGYLERCNEGNCDIYTTFYENGNWTVPQKFIINGIGTSNMVRQPAISPDGKRLIFVSNAPGGQGNYDLWMTTRLENAPASTQERITGSQQTAAKLATSSRLSSSASKQTRKYNAAPQSPTTKKSKRSSKKSSETEQPNGNNPGWDVPVNLGTIVNTKGDEMYPVWVSNNAVSFSSDGHVGYGGLDLYIALADSVDNFHGLKHVEAPINSSFDEHTLVVDPKIERAFFSTGRYIKFGYSDEIFSFPKAASAIELNFIVIDSITELPLPEALVSVCGTDSCVTLQTDSAGQTKYVKPKESRDYSLAFSKPGYTTETRTFQLDDALDIIPMREERSYTIALTPALTPPEPEPQLAQAPQVPIDTIPAEWTFWAENRPDTSDIVDIMAAAKLDSTAKLFAVQNPCIEDFVLQIKLNPSPNYTQTDSVITISQPYVYHDSTDSCDYVFFENEALFKIPIAAADTVEEFMVDGTVTYVIDSPDTTMIFNEIPFSVPVKLPEKAPQIIDTTPVIDTMPAPVVEEPVDTMPAIIWLTSVRQFDDNPDAELLITAYIKPNYELVSEHHQDEPFAPVTFRFKPDPENYDLVDDPIANILPIVKTIPIADGETPVAYYKDSVTFVQQVRLNSKQPFRINAEMDYMLCKDVDYELITNVPLSFPILGEEEPEPIPVPMPEIIEDETPLITWQYSVDQPDFMNIEDFETEESEKTADLIFKASIKPDVILLSDEQTLNELLAPIKFMFDPDPDFYTLVGTPKASFTPLTFSELLGNQSVIDDVLDSTINNLASEIPISYFKDSITFVQKVKIHYPGDFPITGKMDYVIGLNGEYTPYSKEPFSFAILGGQGEKSEGPVFNNKITASDDCADFDISECMQPGMSPEEIIACLDQKKKDCEQVDLRTVDNYKDRVNDPDRRANMAVLPKDTPCKDCEESPQRHTAKEDLFVLSGDDKKTLKLTDNAGNTTYIDLAPNTKYQVSVANALTELAAKLPENVTLSDLVKTSSTKDYIIYECLPKLAEIGDEVYVNNIYYDFDKSDIIKDGHRELDRLIIIAIKNPQLMFELTSHADERGSSDYNLSLTERRLKSVTEYIRKKGLDMSRLITKAVGKSDPLVKNALVENEHALNRRTTIRLYNPQAINELATVAYEIPEDSPLNKKGLWFRIQVGAFRVAPEYPLYFFGDYLNAAPDVKLSYYLDRDGFYRFTMGEFSNPNQARKLCQQILDANKECYVVAYVDGQRITVSEAEVILKRMAKK